MHMWHILTFRIIIGISPTHWIFSSKKTTDSHELLYMVVAPQNLLSNGIEWRRGVTFDNPHLVQGNKP